MASKWTVYFLTLISFALVHSIRSSWSSLKSMLYDHPFNMSAKYLGVLDMTTLFSLAITVSLLGSQVEKYGPKKILSLGLLILAGLTLLIGFCLFLKITSKILYFFVYGLTIGIISACGWPSCLSILSTKFSKKNNVALPLWNGTSQLGDLIALFISDLFIMRLKINGFYTMVAIAILIIIVIFLNQYYLPNDMQNQNQEKVYQLNEQKIPQVQLKIQNILKNSEGFQKRQKQLQQNEQVKNTTQNLFQTNKGLSQQNQIQQVQSGQNDAITQCETLNLENKPVNFMNVWCLPSVSGYVIAIALVKSVNSMLVAWLVFYMYQLEMNSQARIIAIIWSVFVFLGGALGGYFNPTYSKKIFIFSLSVSAIMFLFLQQIHKHTSQIWIISILIICALFYGGPYNLMSTAIPLVLSEKPQIKNRPNAKSAVIAVIDGFSKLSNGFILLIVPQFGVLNMHLIGFGLCIIATLILVVQQYKQKRHIKQPQIILKLGLKRKSQNMELKQTAKDTQK